MGSGNEWSEILGMKCGKCPAKQHIKRGVSVPFIFFGISVSHINEMSIFLCISFTIVSLSIGTLIFCSHT